MAHYVSSDYSACECVWHAPEKLRVWLQFFLGCNLVALKRKSNEQTGTKVKFSDFYPVSVL